jgi:hypothetical protein
MASSTYTPQKLPYSFLTYSYSPPSLMSSQHPNTDLHKKANKQPQNYENSLHNKNNITQNQGINPQDSNLDNRML